MMLEYGDEYRGRTFDRTSDTRNGSNHSNNTKKSKFRTRVRRWDQINPQTGMYERTVVPGIPFHVQANLPSDALQALSLRIRIDEITQKLIGPAGGLEADIIHNTISDDRSPSPDPIYDSNGKRLNTRDVRMKDKLMYERQRLIEMAVKMNPHFRPPADYKPVFNKKYRKIPIPIKEHPDYNFIGLIIGPRGMTQKNMEKETNCKIAIRGRGSMKDGKTYSKGNKIDPKISSDDEDIHVLITGDRDEDVEKAAEMIRKLLEPVDEDKNEHKRMQLRKLAEINGTLRDFVWTDKFERRQGPEIVCSICGDGSHPSFDCPSKVEAKKKLDSEYESFLTEIGIEPEKKDDVDDYDEFMRSIGVTDVAPPPPPTTASAPPPWLQQDNYSQQPPPPPPPSGAPPPWLQDSTPPPPPPPPGQYAADFSQFHYQYDDQSAAAASASGFYPPPPPPPENSSTSGQKRSFSDM